MPAVEQDGNTRATGEFTASDHARALRRTLGLPAPRGGVSAQADAAELWADSGAMALTGRADGPPRECPAPLAACAAGAWRLLAEYSAGRLDPAFPAHRLLGERAALSGLARNGAISPGGACRLLRTRDGMLALNLPRAEDHELLAAWLEADVDGWSSISVRVQECELDALIGRGRLLGLAVAPFAAPRERGSWFDVQRCGAAVQQRAGVPLVLDLGALWAAPLCAQLLGQLGARVIKVESSHRPDGARNGPAPFFDLMNAGKQSVALDLRTGAGREALLGLIASADIVVESARPRALGQMGIDAARIVAGSPGKSWIGITGYGRADPMGDWIAYGDDAGIAAGLGVLLERACGEALFCADAIADPLTGLHAALLAWISWLQGGGSLFDISLHGVTAFCTGSAGVGPSAVAPVAAAPVARAAAGRAAPLGADTAAVLAEFAA